MMPFVRPSCSRGNNRMYEEQTNDTDRDRTPRCFGKIDLEPTSGDLVARSAVEMFEEFLYPDWDEYCRANCDDLGQIVRRKDSKRSKDELMKMAISLALAALELAEIELLDRLNEVYLETTAEIVID
jgi:hypothetical protein